MNTEDPHDIVPLAELRRKPPSERARYRPIPAEEAPRLGAMTTEQRAHWLEEHPLKPHDLELIARAQAKRDRKAARKLDGFLRQADSLELEREG